jgi:predicted DNA-binding protein YlxM (UPF0122 family)
MYSKYEEKLMTFQQFQQQPNITQEQKDKLIDDIENQSRLDDMND